MKVVDFNSDLGESFGQWRLGADDVLMTVISSANVACGFHAGDPRTMRATVTAARAHRVALGAHPGFPDLLGFGRRTLGASPADVKDYVLYQIGALGAFARATGSSLHHVKPHGALYVMVLQDGSLARAVAEAVSEFDETLPVYTLADSEMWDAAVRTGIRPVPEFFADRPIRRDGTVVMFEWQHLFDPTPQAVAGRVASFMSSGAVPSIEGDPVAVSAATICVHSDTPGAGAIGPAVRAAIERAGAVVSSDLTIESVPSG
jgi:UPF0271 protein